VLWRILFFFDKKLPSSGTATCRNYDPVSAVTINKKGLNPLVAKDLLKEFVFTCIYYMPSGNGKILENARECHTS
jgi:hypothetical protein